MLFTTISFWAIFIAFLLFFILFRKTTKLAMMLYVIAFSLAIYAYSTKELMLLLPCIGVFTWSMTEYMRKFSGKKRKYLLALIIITDLLPLLYFKYTVLLASLWQMIVSTNFSIPTILVPVGISFFTFQAISYAVDVYRENFTDKVSIIEFLFYLSFFPLIFAGPITRAEHFFTNFRVAPHKSPLPPIPSQMLYTGLWFFYASFFEAAYTDGRRTCAFHSENNRLGISVDIVVK